jgi:uncharacterized membrane protein YhaH (DUF805 family)
MNLRDLVTWDGTLGRGKYALIGLVGVAIKHNLDHLIASPFHQYWNFFSLWLPLDQVGRLHQITDIQRWYLLSLLITAIPFIWVGLVCTLKRLRDADLPLWMVLLFFAPFINLLFFAILCAVPGRTSTAVTSPRKEPERAVEDFWPSSAMGSAALAILPAAAIGVLGAYFSIVVLGNYGWTLFVALPFVMGYVAVWIYCRSGSRTFTDVLRVVSWSILWAGIGISAIAIEGLICIAMAAPVAWVLALIGGLLALRIHNREATASMQPYTLGAVVLSLPLLFGVEHAAPPPVPRFQVHTAIEIAAPPEVVWKRIISFPELPPPTEWIFRYAHIAYPIEARIRGEGLTADRECRFSTGSFKEPILAWEPGKHFAFGVADEPLLMTETSPYGQIHVRHLEEHDFQPERADFVLTPLPNGGTRLDGTTTYRNKMWPAEYWRLWTDKIVHGIHSRVFEHVKKLSEQDAAEARSSLP